jgi:hypothetical protein
MMYHCREYSTLEIFCTGLFGEFYYLSQALQFRWIGMLELHKRRNIDSGRRKCSIIRRDI